MSRVKIIAEAGVNHNGSLDQALRLVDAAKAAGADIIKFQTFKSELLVAKSAPMAEYQKINTKNFEKSQFEMIKELELTQGEFFKIYEHCRNVGIEFLSTPFDIDSLRFLLKANLISVIKVPSGEIVNGALLFEAALSKCPIILSTGMSYISEISQALDLISYAAVKSQVPTSTSDFFNFRKHRGAQTHLESNVTLLHCTTDYPTRFEDVNLRAMSTLKKEFGVQVGYSDHSLGITVPLAAVAMGATVIEKHFTLDKSLSGPDHKASLDPMELKEMVRSIREVEICLGDGQKIPTSREQKNLVPVRRSLAALKPIKKGEIFCSENLGALRPGSGISPAKIWDYFNRPAHRGFEPEEFID